MGKRLYEDRRNHWFLLLPGLVLQKNLLLGPRNKERLSLRRLKQQLLLPLVLLVGEEVLVVRGGVRPLTTSDVHHRSLGC